MRKQTARNTYSSHCSRIAKNALQKHNPYKAMQWFNTAIRYCPENKNTELSAYFYWLSISLKQLGKEKLAIRALHDAANIYPRSKAARVLKHLENPYGMKYTGNADVDDYRAFCCIQIKHYLDMYSIEDLSEFYNSEQLLVFLAASWLKLKASVDLSSMSAYEKTKFFSSYVLNFSILCKKDTSTLEIFKIVSK